MWVSVGQWEALSGVMWVSGALCKVSVGVWEVSVWGHYGSVGVPLWGQCGSV